MHLVFDLFFLLFSIFFVIQYWLWSKLISEGVQKANMQSLLAKSLGNKEQDCTGDVNTGNNGPNVEMWHSVELSARRHRAYATPAVKYNGWLPVNASRLFISRMSPPTMFFFLNLTK